MVALAACQKEVQETVQQPVLDEGLEGELIEVTFNVDVTDATQTKAISDGLSANKLQYAVYRAETYVNGNGESFPAGQYIPSLSQGDDPNASFSNAKIEKIDNKTWKVVLTLAKNVKYDIVFWAYVDGAPYNFDEENAQIVVTDNYEGLANAENRDAFYGICHEYSVISSDTKVELRRPFAQINFGSSDYDPYVTDLGLTMTSTFDTERHDAVEAVYEYNDPVNGRLLYPARPSVASCTVPTILNVLTGGVEGGAEVSFATGKIPYETGDKVLLTTGEGADLVTYHWMGMNYILASADHATIDNIHAVFTYNNKDLVVDVPNVPYKRNYKTNILGNIFTSHAQFNVVIIPYYEGTYVRDLEVYSTLNTIEKALYDAHAVENPSVVATLTADLALESTITVPTGIELTVDLGGKTITSNAVPAFLVNGKLNITNGNVVVPGEFVRAGAEAKVTLTNVDVVSGSTTAKGDNCVFVPKDSKNVEVVVGERAVLTSYGAPAIQCNGLTVGLVLTVNGKVTSVGEHAMYLPQVKTCTIEANAEITGVTGVEIRGGKLDIYGGKITADGEFSAANNNNGTTVNGAAVAVSPHTTDLPIYVNVYGGELEGELKGAYSLYEANFQGAARTAETKILVTEGTCKSTVSGVNITYMK